MIPAPHERDVYQLRMRIVIDKAPRSQNSSSRCARPPGIRPRRGVGSWHRPIGRHGERRLLRQGPCLAQRVNFTLAPLGGQVQRATVHPAVRFARHLEAPNRSTRATCWQVRHLDMIELDGAQGMVPPSIDRFVTSLTTIQTRTTQVIRIPISPSSPTVRSGSIFIEWRTHRRRHRRRQAGDVKRSKSRTRPNCKSRNTSRSKSTSRSGSGSRGRCSRSAPSNRRSCRRPLSRSMAQRSTSNRVLTTQSTNASSMAPKVDWIWPARQQCVLGGTHPPEDEPTPGRGSDCRVRPGGSATRSDDSLGHRDCPHLPRRVRRSPAKGYGHIAPPCGRSRGRRLHSPIEYGQVWLPPRST